MLILCVYITQSSSLGKYTNCILEAQYHHHNKYIYLGKDIYQSNNISLSLIYRPRSDSFSLGTSRLTRLRALPLVSVRVTLLRELT